LFNRAFASFYIDTAGQEHCTSSCGVLELMQNCAPVHRCVCAHEFRGGAICHTVVFFC